MWRGYTKRQLVADLRMNIFIDNQFDSYHNFFSDDWGERILALVTGSPTLHQFVFDLLMDWRAAAYTAALPAQILEHVKHFHDGYLSESEPNTFLLRFSEGVIGRLALEIPELTRDPPLLRRLQTKIVELGAETQDIHRKVKIEFPMEETWQDYLKFSAYQLSLWGSQRICYVAIYNSYENFLTQCVATANGIAKCRTTNRDFKRLFADVFGEPLHDQCWSNNAVNIARLARHALSHAGGRVTPDLAKQNHDFVVTDNAIQVIPANTKELFNLLKECAYSLAEAARTMPQFK